MESLAGGDARSVYFNQFPKFETHPSRDRASPVALVVKNSSASAGDGRDSGSIPRLGRCLGEGDGNLLQYSCLENSMDRRALWATAHGVARDGYD